MSVQESIKQQLTERFHPHHLEVCNDSDQHRVAPGSESHFSVVLVTDYFCEQPLLARHRAVNEVLAAALAGPVHALALHTYTIAEWHNTKKAPRPPECMGGQGDT